MRAVNLKTEYLKNPMGIDIKYPRLFWNCEGGKKQTAYRIVAASDMGGVWDSGKVSGDTMSAAYPKALSSRERVVWTVQLWDEADRAGEKAEAFFETGLLSPAGSYKLSILTANDPEGSNCARQFFEYPGHPGTGHLLHTYVCDGTPIPSFAGEPKRVALPGDIDALTDTVWNSLNPDNKVSLFVRFTNLETRRFEQRLRNKNLEKGAVL